MKGSAARRSPVLYAYEQGGTGDYRKHSKDQRSDG